MLRITLVLLFAATSVFAQTEEAPPRVAIPVPPPASPCTSTTVDLEGKVDAFAQPADQTTPTPALQQFLSTKFAQSQYDTPGCDKHWGESFRICGCETCGARLELRVRRCGSNLDLNDTYVVGVAPFTPALIVASGAVWQSGDGTEKTLWITLPQQKLTQVLCGNKAEFLDVYVQDDTIVDYARLHLQQP